VELLSNATPVEQTAPAEHDTHGMNNFSSSPDLDGKNSIEISGTIAVAA
jgi:hypothetical protein